MLRPGRALRRPVTMLALALVSVFALAAACGGGSSPAPATSREVTATADQNGKTWAGTDAAPEFPGGLTWFNVAQPVTLADLRGKMVLLDFWTLGCINCQHIIPDLARLEKEFGDSLVVIGVHSGKYSAEHDNDAIREAIERYGLEHPVVNDPDFAFWNAYGARAWPTLVLIDPAGNLVGSHAGEGVYPLFQPILAALKEEFAGRIDAAPFPVVLDRTVASTVLYFPAAVLADEPRDRLYIADSGHNRILEATMEGRLLRAFGNGERGFADGAPNEASFYDPQGLELSADGGTLYVADTRNHALRTIDLANGRVETIAGTGERAESLPKDGDDPRKTALASPWGLLRHGDMLYIAMAGTHQIWSYDLSGQQLAVFAGTSREGIDDGNRLSMATLAQPSGMTTDGHYLYWVDPESSAVRRVPFDGEIVDTLVGTGLFDWGDQDGGPGEGQIQHAQGIAYHDGLLYLADTYNNKLKTLDPVRLELKTVAGSGDAGWSDGAGGAVQFDELTGLTAADGRTFIADTNNHLVRIYTPSSGKVSTLELSNLAVAASTGAGEVTQVELERQVVATGAANLRLMLHAPEGYHLNSLAPSSLDLATSNPSVLSLGETHVSWETDEASIDLPVPVMAAPGETTVTASGVAYYCEDGAEALCLIQRLELVLPVSVEEGAKGGEVVIDYELSAASDPSSP